MVLGGPPDFKSGKEFRSRRLSGDRGCEMVCSVSNRSTQIDQITGVVTPVGCINVQPLHARGGPMVSCRRSIKMTGHLPTESGMLLVAGGRRMPRSRSWRAKPERRENLIGRWHGRQHVILFHHYPKGARRYPAVHDCVRLARPVNREQGHTFEPWGIITPTRSANFKFTLLSF